jgi:hypothetical protein
MSAAPSPGSRPHRGLRWILPSAGLGLLAAFLCLLFLRSSSRPAKATQPTSGTLSTPSTRSHSALVRTQPALRTSPRSSLFPPADPAPLDHPVVPSPTAAVALELGWWKTEMQWLIDQGELQGDAGRDAARLAGQLLTARFLNRTRFIGPDPVDEPPWPKPGEGQGAAATGDPTESALQPGWKDAATHAQAVHPEFAQRALTEMQRVGVPPDWQPMLTRFLVESVRDIEVLAEIGQVQLGGQIRPFPEAITRATGPLPGEEDLLAAYYYRESTRRMLERMGVPVDTQFAERVLGRGLGRSVELLTDPAP